MDALASRVEIIGTRINWFVERFCALLVAVLVIDIWFGILARYGLELGKADAEFVRRQTGFAIGGVPPVAHAMPLRCLLDQSLQRHAEIWAAAGTPESVFRMMPAQLHTITGGAWQDITED